MLIGKCGEPLERARAIGLVDPGAAERAAQQLDRLIVGPAIDRERRAVLAAVGEGEARRVARAGAGAMDQLGDQGSGRRLFGPRPGTPSRLSKSEGGRS